MSTLQPKDFRARGVRGLKGDLPDPVLAADGEEELAVGVRDLLATRLGHSVALHAQEGLAPRRSLELDVEA